MLPYFRNYAFIAYIIGVATPVILVTALSWIFGFYIVATLPGLIAAILLMIVSLLTAKKIVTAKADRKADEMISLYNEKCDPAAFVESARVVASEIRPPYDGTGSWFLSFYALALDDLGQRNDAARIGQAMLSSAQMATDPQTKVAILVNIEPLVQRLFGVVQALEVVDQAQAVLAGSTDPDDVSRMNFLNWERGILEAIRDGDDEALVRRFSAIRGNDGYPMRVRVSDALLEASVHKSRGNAADERECLLFVVRNGNQLPAVKLANERLAELG